MPKMHIQYKLRTLHLQETCLYDRLRIYRRTAQGSAHTEKMTQEQLAAMTDVGTTHISHIETGMTIPSTKLLVQMMNILDCDPAEVLCMEMRSARPVLNSWLSDLVADCNEDEVKIITDTVMALKASLHRNRSEDK